MILEIALSIVVTFGGALTGNFGECPAASDPATVSAPQDTTSTTTTVKQPKKG